MAENWYATKAGVREKLYDLKSTNLITPDLSLDKVLSERTQQLIDLRNIVFQKEQNFFNSFDSLHGLPPRVALETLQMLIGIWNASGARHMVSNQSISTVLDILVNPHYSRIDIKELEEIASDFFEEEASSVFKDEADQIVVAELIKGLNKILEKNEQPKLPIYHRKKVNGEKVLHSYFTVSFEDGQYHLTFESNLDAATKRKLKKGFQLLLEEKMKKRDDRFSEAKRNAEMIQSIILKPISDSRVRQAVKNELTIGRIEQYNFARDFNVIKGFLGEVYWTAFFNFLGATATPTGDIKDKDTGQSIGIDLVVGAYGFQVKNFNIRADGSIQFGTRGGLKEAGTFISDRAGIDGPLGELLLNLYGSYAYNLDVSDGEFTQTREELEKFLIEDASKIFTHYIDRIIRLDAEQTMPIEIFDGYYGANEKKLLFNAFFLISDKIVPSSAILDEIIYGLQTQQPRSIDFLITKIERKEDAPKYDEEVNWIAKKMANYARIAYNINFNVKNIIENAYRNVGK